MPLSAQDRLDIQELMARYAQAVDVDGAEGQLFDIFSSDAVLDSPMSGKFAGNEGLKAFAKVVAELRSGRIGRHLITNIRIQGEGDRAQLQACYVHASTPRDTAATAHGATVTHTGTYDCSARRQDGRWRLERRTVTVDGR
jgi:ketosteroid isomerase-like protein